MISAHQISALSELKLLVRVRVWGWISVKCMVAVELSGCAVSCQWLSDPHSLTDDIRLPF